VGGIDEHFVGFFHRMGSLARSLLVQVAPRDAQARWTLQGVRAPVVGGRKGPRADIPCPMACGQGIERLAAGGGERRPFRSTTGRSLIRFVPRVRSVVMVHAMRRSAMGNRGPGTPSVMPGLGANLADRTAVSAAVCTRRSDRSVSVTRIRCAVCPNDRDRCAQGKSSTVRMRCAHRRELKPRHSHLELPVS
jgi:hypothetical protein